VERLGELEDSTHFPAQILGGDPAQISRPSFPEMGSELHQIFEGHRTVTGAPEFVSDITTMLCF